MDCIGQSQIPSAALSAARAETLRVLFPDLPVITDYPMLKSGCRGSGQLCNPWHDIAAEKRVTDLFFPSGHAENMALPGKTT